MAKFLAVLVSSTSPAREAVVLLTVYLNYFRIESKGTTVTSIDFFTHLLGLIAAIFPFRTFGDRAEQACRTSKAADDGRGTAPQYEQAQQQQHGHSLPPSSGGRCVAPWPADFAKMRVMYEPQTRSFRLSVPLPTTTSGGGGVEKERSGRVEIKNENWEIEGEKRSIPVVSRVTAKFQSIADYEDKITLDAFVHGNFVVWLHPRTGAGRLANAKSASPLAKQSQLKANGEAIPAACVVLLLLKVTEQSNGRERPEQAGML
ncbi:hypothetical protein DFJ73DRAFT_758143 [Zopfochytrium polystomum]|nr:hypothetical protein DFJ73DRAFT_758143 [Zopfochytrium polystomum]